MTASPPAPTNRISSFSNRASHDEVHESTLVLRQRTTFSTCPSSASEDELTCSLMIASTWDLKSTISRCQAA